MPRLFVMILMLSLLLNAHLTRAELRQAESAAFVITHEATVPVDPDSAYDLLTGDISGWWDHRFQTDGGRFFIEARPGGGFFEYFDEEGDNGVLHGTVIYAERGKRLSYRGPLGFNGNALEFVITYYLEPFEGGTLVKVEVHGEGEIEPGWAEAIDGVWHHFLIERYVPYVEARATAD